MYVTYIYIYPITKTSRVFFLYFTCLIFSFQNPTHTFDESIKFRGKRQCNISAYGGIKIITHLLNWPWKLCWLSCRILALAWHDRPPEAVIWGREETNVLSEERHSIDTFTNQTSTSTGRGITIPGWAERQKVSKTPGIYFNAREASPSPLGFVYNSLLWFIWCLAGFNVF